MSVRSEVRRFSWARIKKHVLFVGLTVVGILDLYPLLYAFLGSLSTHQEIMDTLFLPTPANPFVNFIENYKMLFSNRLIMAQMGNSLFLTFGKILWQLAVTVFISVLCGYVFAKVEFVGKSVLFLILMSSMMIPGVALIVPNFLWMHGFPLAGGNNILGQGGSGFIDNPAMIFLTGWVNVYNIFLCRQAFVSLGDEISESAQIDGANFFRIVFTIFMPLIAPILAVMFLNLFIGIWNDYLGNLIYFPNNTRWHTVANVFMNIMNYYSDLNQPQHLHYGISFAVSLINMIPPIIVYIFVQKQFAEGLTLGAVKG